MLNFSTFENWHLDPNTPLNLWFCRFVVMTTVYVRDGIEARELQCTESVIVLPQVWKQWKPIDNEGTHVLYRYVDLSIVLGPKFLFSMWRSWPSSRECVTRVRSLWMNQIFYFMACDCSIYTWSTKQFFWRHFSQSFSKNLFFSHSRKKNFSQFTRKQKSLLLG